MDQLYEQVTHALDVLKLEQAAHPCTEDWITVSIPKLRIGASPLIASALDAIEKDPEHRKVFISFVNDAITNPSFRNQLKKSLRDPSVILMVKALMGQNQL